MVCRGNHLFGAEYGQAALLQSLESLGRSDFMDEVTVDIEHGRPSFDGADHVAVPDFFE
jgi:hypothetical protein